MHDDDNEWSKLYHHHASPVMPIVLSQQPWMSRRPSVSSHPHATSASHTTLVTPGSPRLKGKEPSLDGPASRRNPNSTASRSSESSTPPSLPHFQHHSTSFPSKHRTGILAAASDALGFRKKIGSVSRKKPNFNSLSSTSNDMPEVIEISACNNTTITSTIGGTATHMDYEHEERERLRDMAAQSIGLDPELLHNSCKSQSGSSLDSHQDSPQPARIPPFPATLAALYPFTELSSTLPKFTPPSSLLVYALAKQWKPRIIVLTSHYLSHKTHVHLFKGSSKDDREMERLEVTEQSVIFVAEEEVGGRGNVVKLAGKDVSAKRNTAVGEDGLHTMWFLQIINPAESQRWIAAIKNAVLAQRAVRAGLDISAPADGGNEPKGDIDVMLSMHLQGLISAHPTKPISFPSSAPATPSPPPSLRSLKMNASPLSSPASAMKGIFTGTRPRSPSVEGSPTSTYPPTHVEDSFGAASANLLTMLRTKSSADSNSSPPHSLPLTRSHVSGSPAPSLRSTNPPVIITASDLKISKDRDVPDLSTAASEAVSSNTPPDSNTPPTPSLSPQGTLTLSLQPPPRKYKHIPAIIPASFIPEREGMYRQAHGNRSVAGNFGIVSGSSGDVTPRETSPVSPGSSSIYLRGRSGSFSPNSGLETQPLGIDTDHGDEQNDEVAPIPFGNGIVNRLSPLQGRSVPPDNLLQGTITKRWSRQGVPIPKQLTPPSGPPPSIPPSSENNPRTSTESSMSVSVTYTNTSDRSPGSSSSNSQFQSRFSSKSGPSMSPTFWKRASGCSTYSVSSTSTSDSRGWSQMPAFSGKESPPSTGSIVAKGTSSRPMSLLVPVSPPVKPTSAVKRRSMPPPRPAPKFAPPPAPAIQESPSGSNPLVFTSAERKSFRSSVAQRALRLSLTSPKPPPSAALPPRPDEAVFAPAHRRSSSTGTPDPQPVSAPSSRPSSALSLSRNSNSIDPVSPPTRNFSIKQRLRILSTPPTSPSPVQSPSFWAPSLQVSTLDLSDDNDNDDLPTPCFQPSQSFRIGEHIVTVQNDPSFLQLSTPVTPTAPKLPPRSHSRSLPPLSSAMSGSRTPSLEPDRDFVALSPPPRRGCKPFVSTVKRPGIEVDGSGSAHREESKPATLPQRGSVVSLGFAMTS